MATPARSRIAAPFVTALVLVGCGGVERGVSTAAEVPAADAVPVKVIKAYPHDPLAFTQGLLIEDGVLYESTGEYGESTLRIVDLETGKPRKIVRLSRRLFAEGLAAIDDRLVQLTWQAGIGVVYDRETLKPTGRFSYRGEGWGLTADGERLYMSDGTATIRVLDPETFRVVDRIGVTLGGRPLKRLNELEWVGGEIYANVWFEPFIARIDPATGVVVGRIDCSAVVARYRRAEHQVLNGIAFDRDAGRLFITGKDWPVL
ncbi:MAG: glutaminyl-peptide cyclotransferase, partial [Planctomycetota bacterium]